MPTFPATVIEQQRAPLEHDAPAPPQRQRRRVAQAHDLLAEDADRAGDGPLEHDDLAQQRRLARSASPDEREDLARPHRQLDVLVHDRRAEARADAADVDHSLRIARTGGRGAHSSSHRKTIENIASVTMTRKIAWTTLIVVCVPTLSALPVTWNPR
jgi:hypothetical protein